MSNSLMKNILFSILIIIFLFSLLYFFYMKPERKYTEKKVDNCIEEAINPVDSVINQSHNYYKNYKNDYTIKKLTEQRNTKLNTCMKEYHDRYIFLPAEKKSLNLRIKELTKTQEEKIEKYNKERKEKLLEYKQEMEERRQENKKRSKCYKMKPVYEKYKECVQDKNFGTFFPSESDDPECLKEHNYKKFGVTPTECIIVESGL